MSKSTIKDVARAAGVSVGSVSRVLNGLPVSPHMKQSVEQAMARLSYEPNSLARSMRTNSTGAIGYFVPDVANPLYGAIITAVDQRLKDRGLMLLLASARGRSGREVLAEFRRRRVDGLIFTPDSETDPDLIRELAAFNAPTVIQTVRYPDNFFGVRIGYRAALRAATDYLLGLGHRRIALLTPLAELWPGRERIAGFQEAFTLRGLDLADALVRPQHLSLDPEQDALTLLRSDNPPTAMIMPGTRVLAGVLRAARACQRSVPRDLSLISIGDNEWVSSHDPAITTLRWPVDILANAIVDLLVGQIDHLRTEPLQVTVPAELVVRESCSAPPAGKAR